LRERLRILDVHIVVYDPYLTHQEAEDLGVEKVSLEELFHRSDVASLHTPLMSETGGMITGRLLASMKRNATFINTARGAVVKEGEMIEVLLRRPDLYAVLDVADGEPPQPSSPLYTLPNVVLSPHIAGSRHSECARMGQLMVDEALRFLDNRPLRWEVTQAETAVAA
jgi:phosphoglycerate dehydrogenase-like enzyme